MHGVPCGKPEYRRESIKKFIFVEREAAPPVVHKEEVQVENDGSKNSTAKRPQTSVDVAVQKAG